MRAIWAVLVLAAGCAPAPEVTGRADFQTFCAVCHGADGKGDGRSAAELWLDTPDLTQIAAQNGGVFPTTQVMSTIDGYTRTGHPGSQMPEFGPLLAGPTVLVEYEDGAISPTPERLVALATYLESIQE